MDVSENTTNDEALEADATQCTIILFFGEKGDATMSNVLFVRSHYMSSSSTPKVPLTKSLENSALGLHTLQAVMVKAFSTLTTG